MGASEARTDLSGDTPETLQPDRASGPPSATSNPILAHWRGEYVPYSYAQGSAIALAIVALLIAHFAIPYPVVFRKGPQVALLAARQLLIFIPVYGWLLVGLWRSGASFARRQAAAGLSTRYGREVQAAVVAIGLVLTWDFVTHFPFLYSLVPFFFLP